MRNTTNYINSLLKKDIFWFSICFIFIVLYFLPYIILGQDSHLLIHDNLDSAVAFVKILLNHGDLFFLPSEKTDQIFNGIRLTSISGNFDISLIWFKLLGVFWGYVFNKFLMAIVGFLGMYLLLKNHFLSSEDNSIIQFGIALIFALLPFWSFTMSVAGLPLLLYSFLNLRKKAHNYYNWVIIILFPFYSSLVLSGIFFMTVIIVLIIYDLIKYQTLNSIFIYGIALLGTMYIVSHFNLFYSFLHNSGYVSHRVEFDAQGSSIKGSIYQMIIVFFQGQFHAPSLHTFALIPIFTACLLMIKSVKADYSFLYILFFIFITSVFYGFLEWESIAPIKKQLMSLIPIQLQRFHWLHPMFWYILLGISLAMIKKYFRFGPQIVYFFLFFQFIYVISCHELIQNKGYPTFRQFYAEEQFSDVKSFIGKPQQSYRVISVGIHPSIAQFNGFYTLDGYISDYPLSYKHKFRTIIENELSKDSNLKEYFDTWGSRCYAFSSELGRDFVTSNPKKINRLDYNFKVLKEMGCEYIISKVEINTEINSRLNLLKIFNNKNSYWTIYLYNVQ